MPSSNNNTTGLSEQTTSINLGGYIPGTIGQRDFKDFNAKEISGGISRQNFKEQVKYDKKLNEFRKAVYKIVMGYSTEDKLNIISSYGDASQLKGKKLNEEVINNVCTETLIIHLDPATLKQLIADMGMKEATLKRSVKEDMKRKRTFTGFNTDTFNDVYKMIKNSKGTDFEKNFGNAMKTIDRSYGVPKYIRNQYPKLRKELYDVLQTCYDKISIARLAREMDINAPAGTTYSEAYKWIINKTVLYVSLILGKSKNADIANTIINPAPFEELLQYTSYSYITGKPGLDPNEWSAKKDAARRAKKAIAERTRMKKDLKNSFGRITRSSEFSELTGGVTGFRRTGLFSMASRFKYADTGILKDASYDDLIQLAGKYGIDPTDKKGDVGILKSRIYAAMAAEAKRVGKLIKKRDTALSGGLFKRAGKLGRAPFDLLSIHGISSAITQGSANIDVVDTVGGSNLSGTPVITLHRDGTVRTKQILSAVPVYIIGQGLGGDRRTQEEIDKTNSQIESIKNLSKNKKFRKTNANIFGQIDINMTKDDLSDEDRKILNFFMTLPKYSSHSGKISSIEDVENFLIKNYYIESYELKPLRFDKSGTEKNIRDIQLNYCWLYAKATGRTKLAAYLTKEYNIFFNIKIKKRNHLGKAIGILNDLFSTPFVGSSSYITSALSIKSNAKLDNGSISDETPTNSVLAIPKISVSGGSINVSDIVEVVPVYVVNNDITKKIYERGIGKNTDLATLINAGSGINYGGDNSVYIEDISEILKEMKAKGYTPTSAAFKNIKSTDNEKNFKLTTQDMEWIRKNNVKTGKGGVLGKLSGPFKNNSKITDFAKSKKINKILAIPAIPVVNVGKDDNSEKIINAITDFKDTYTSEFSTFKTLLGAGFELAAPMGVGKGFFAGMAVSGAISKAKQAATKIASSAFEATAAAMGINTASTGGDIVKMASGGTTNGTSAIVGDAAGSNIFKNGAKPELVQSSGNMSVIPLNKAGTESQKINRMTSSERKSALATSLSSHIIKYSYMLPEGSSEVSNSGEAIKVFNVKPGITDTITVGSTTTTMAEMIMAIYNQLVTMGTISGANTNLLTTIAANTAIQQTGSNSSTGIFTNGFTSNLDGILGGN